MTGQTEFPIHSGGTYTRGHSFGLPDVQRLDDDYEARTKLARKARAEVLDNMRQSRRRRILTQKHSQTRDIQKESPSIGDPQSSGRDHADFDVDDASDDVRPVGIDQLMKTSKRQRGRPRKLSATGVVPVEKLMPDITAESGAKAARMAESMLHTKHQEIRTRDSPTPYRHWYVQLKPPNKRRKSTQGAKESEGQSERGTLRSF